MVLKRFGCGLGAVILLCAAAAAQTLKPAPGPVLDLARLLPGPAEAKGWTPAGDPQIYKGEDLFLYIDGGAEIYHEYGFRQVAAREYKNSAGETLSLEIYEMADAAAAFGMFTFKSSATGKPLDVGQGGRIEDYYLNFWKGPCLVTLTAFDQTATCLAGIEPLARAVEAKMATTGERPAILDAVPEDWSENGRVVYFRGFIGLNNIRTLLPSDVFRFREGLAIERPGTVVFVFAYRDAAEASARLEILRKAFAASPLYQNLMTREGGGFDAIVAKGGRLSVRLKSDRIGLALVDASAPAGTDPAALLSRLK